MTMRLSTRLTLFFLAALALVLVGFSASLYLLASKYLHRQADERLEAALNTLTAAAEVGPDGVEWEPEERSLSFGRRTVEGHFFWRVFDPSGRRLDGSSSDEADELLRRTTLPENPSRRAATGIDRAGRTWRVMERRLDANPPLPRDARGRIGPAVRDGRHEALVIVTGLSLEGVNATLRNFALVSGGLSLGIWALALVSGRRLCRRALRPVTEMAEAAQAIGGDELDGRLPAPETDDELGELGRSFNALLGRLHESFERQRRFTGDASHQLRTPLTAMQGHVDLALRQGRSVEEYQRVLSLVQRKTRHLRQIVEALLFLARADSESQRPHLVAVELTDYLREHLPTWPDPRGAADVRVEVGPGGPFWVRAQPSLLGELVNNLLDNASKYSEPGTPIVVRLGGRDGEVRLSVEDQGVGITGDEIAHVFEPFYRSPEALRRGKSGIGLGLSIAARLAGSFGGRLGAESSPGRGSTFTLSLPRTAPPADHDAVADGLSTSGPVVHHADADQSDRRAEDVGPVGAVAVERPAPEE